VAAAVGGVVARGAAAGAAVGAGRVGGVVSGAAASYEPMQFDHPARRLLVVDLLAARDDRTGARGEES